MVKLFTQQYQYDNPWPTVTLAFFLRYPNPYAAHVLSCDVLSRTPTPQGTLLTTRLILKRGAVPKWVPQGIVSRAESWIVEESEVDTVGRVVRCTTKNLDHVKIMSVHESVILREGPNKCVTVSFLYHFAMSADHVYPAPPCRPPKPASFPVSVGVWLGASSGMVTRSSRRTLKR